MLPARRVAYSHPAMDVFFVPLVRDAVLPCAAPASTRSPVPPGYGVQEQCLPFTAATALGLLIGSPVSFGYCPIAEVPPGGHPFTSPREQPSPSARESSMVFYVVDDPACRFTGNAFTFELGDGGRVPGLSFFDRLDQQDLFKVHLPYICRTSQGIDALFLAPINRATPFGVLSGLVEADWYASPVNVILRKPTGIVSAHVAKGEAIAQLVFIERAHRRPEVTVLAEHARVARDVKAEMREFDRRHLEDRAVYKKLARTRHGQLIHDESSAPPKR